MECNSPDVVAYTVDADNRITWVCQHWWPFARDNGAPELRDENVLGKGLLDYLSDYTTHFLYALLMDRVRNSQQPRVLDIRCDSPSRRRFMTIRVSALPDAGLAFESRTVREELRAAVPLLDRLAQRSQDTIDLCSWCKRIQVGSAWMEVEPAVAALGLMEQDPPPQIRHTTCPDCLATAMQLTLPGHLPPR